MALTCTVYRDTQSSQKFITFIIWYAKTESIEMCLLRSPAVILIKGLLAKYAKLA